MHKKVAKNQYTLRKELIEFSKANIARLNLKNIPSYEWVERIGVQQHVTKLLLALQVRAKMRLQPIKKEVQRV